MSVKIIVDSTADLIPQVRSRVGVVPLSIRFGDEEFIDGVTIDSRMFYEKLIDGTYISFILLAASVAACLLISYAAMMSPFKSKGKKIFVSLLMIAWAWILAVLIAIFL